MICIVVSGWGTWPSHDDGEMTRTLRKSRNLHGESNSRMSNLLDLEVMGPASNTTVRETSTC